MSKSFEENTKDFYDELNGECDPKRLLYIAEKGIFLKEPLFKYDKIKDNEYVVDISVISDQFFLINNNKQYNRLKYFFKEDRYIYDKYRHLTPSCNDYFSLIIINKYFIEKLLYEKDENFLNEVISTRENYLLEDFIKINENNIEDILRKILIESGKDINILNYCLDKVKRNNSKIKSIEGYRVPMHYCFETLKYYSDELCIKNHLYLKCEDKYAEEFINVCFTDEFIRNFYHFNIEFQEKFSKKYNIDFKEIGEKFEVIDINKINTNENETNENETNENETNENEYINDIQGQLIKIIDPQYKGKLSYIESYELNPGDINFDFINKYLRNYKKIDRILKDPNYILNIDIVINNYTDCLIIKLCYLASLIHNKYSKFIIQVLIFYDEYWHSISYRDDKIVFGNYSGGRYKYKFYIRKIFKILMNTPHKLFNSYFYC
ncbi:hypothetical protein H8356DRAFT_1318916 [Neocallimastix lanati (nom. inval.)]|uniref:Uncharacterized protein n=1 Tax=Neocallimastix californiae TaxID=1754190 RepID=A0A1Y1ZK03_9FUNG|nr:hypothetical protein H8356DRAFT_1318916 [Neocallimastix sp. JGI-2020a]ORY10600.1 hypothetical protein LY90DRAFT_677980 [Neocallimastix californiae]|eukprot:ORY10600.1 hypothetical protein LY90DRAFT_677980 [Neocallimastix californiae]